MPEHIAEHQVREGLILGLGSPLLDISATVTKDFLNKYDLKPNNAIRVGDKQRNLCNDLMENFQVDLIAGGAVQNTIRVAQWFFQKPLVCSVFGGIGQDVFGKQMRKKLDEDKVNAVYVVDDTVPTGTCACLITDNGQNRSLCAYLGASQNLNDSHIRKHYDHVERAKIFYTSGFFLTVCVEASLMLAQNAHQSPGKLFTFNLSAPYISQQYSELLLKVLPYADILFGNETEVLAFAEVQNWKTTNLEVIAQKLADFEHKRPRTVVITQGKNDVLVAVTNATEPLRKFPVQTLSDDEIVDTNGAGDAFVGGFLAYKALDKPLEQCIQAGIYAATEIIKMSGCTFPAENKFRV